MFDSPDTSVWVGQTEFVFQIKWEDNVTLLGFRNEVGLVVCFGVATAARHAPDDTIVGRGRNGFAICEVNIVVDLRISFIQNVHVSGGLEFVVSVATKLACLGVYITISETMIMEQIAKAIVAFLSSNVVHD